MFRCGALDLTDLQLLKLLSVDARITLKDLAKSLDLSTNAVFNRMKNLEEADHLGRIRTRMNYNMIQAVMVSCVLEIVSSYYDELIELCEKSELVDQIIYHTNNFLVINGVLRTIHELPKLNKMFEENSKVLRYESYPMYDPRIMSKNPLSLSFSDIDKQIITSLQYDGRKTIKQIELDTGLTYKTIKKRMDFYSTYNILSYPIDLKFHKDSSAYATVEYVLGHPIEDPFEVLELFTGLLGDYLIGPAPLTETRGLLGIWVPDMKTLAELLRKLDHERIISYTPQVALEAYSFDIWVDNIEEEFFSSI